MTTRRHFVQSAASLAAFGAFPLAAFAQAFEAVKIINGFPAGGTADSTSRRVAEKSVARPIRRTRPWWRTSPAPAAASPAKW